MRTEKRHLGDRDCCQLEAKINFGKVSLRCFVVNLSPEGAGLTLDDDVAELPSQFHLSLPLVDDLMDERLVELRWQKDQTAGVRFVS